MVKSEIIKALAIKFPEITHSDVKVSVTIIIERMAEVLAQNDRIELRDFGSFGIKIHGARKARNPNTGELIHVLPKPSVYFKTGRELRQRINYVPIVVDWLKK